MFYDLNVLKTAYAMATHAGQRQAVIARNMANADTPGYQPRDLEAFQKAFEMTGRDGRVLALSQTAFDALTPAQVTLVERSARLLPVAIPTLETAGGSVRCMIAGIHLSRRSKEG
mgnify:CR=1 FL=1